MPVSVGYSPIALLLLPALVLVLIGLALAIGRLRQRRTRSALVAVITLAAAGVVVAGTLAYGVYQSYVFQNSWTFGYSVSIRANGSTAESVVVPVPTDETLLDGLRLTQGVANWSLVSGPHGRGLFVRYAGSAVLESYISRFPPPAVEPDTSPTMAQPSNCTMPSSNCTGFAEYWMFYSGGAGALVSVSLSWFSVSGYVRPGWDTYAMIPHPVP